MKVFNAPPDIGPWIKMPVASESKALAFVRARYYGDGISVK